MWKESLDDYSWVYDAVKVHEDNLNHRQLYYDEENNQIGVIDNYKLAMLCEKPVAKWGNISKVEPTAIEVTYDELDRYGISTQQFMNSLQKFNTALVDKRTEIIEEKIPEPVILVYQSKPIGEYGTVLKLYGMNPEYVDYINKQIENGTGIEEELRRRTNESND